MFRRISFVLLTGMASASRAAVVINEVAFDQPAGSPDWVELYNNGPSPVSVSGWTIDDQDAAAGNEIVISLSTPIPAGAFLMVYVDVAGTGDTDFSDGTGAVYSGTSTTVLLAATEDELGLYGGPAQSSATIVDFLAWVTDGSYNGTGDQADAAAAGIWPGGVAVALADAGSGYSLGRSADGADADAPDDFLFFSSPTPGAMNAPPAAPGPPPESCANSADDDGDGAADCADADCAAVPACRPPASPRAVVVNEAAWSGSAAGSTREWIELFNNTGLAVSLDGWRLRTDDGDVDVALAGAISPGGYYLLERTSDASVSDRSADLLYAGSLSNDGEDVLLLDASSGVVDQAFFSRSGWPAGSSSPDYRSMERVSPVLDGDLWSNWRSNDGAVRNGLDAAGAPLNGTPGARNSVYSLAGFQAVENCGNGLDDDGDGETDCADADCPRLTACSYAKVPISASETVAVDEASNPFSPQDPDPARRSARIFFHAGSSAAVKALRILDLRGETVRTLLEVDGGPAGSPSGVALWDGADDSGRSVPVGIYVVDFVGTDPASGQSVTGRDTVVVGRPF